MLSKDTRATLEKSGYHLYEKSIRRLDGNVLLFVVRSSDGTKLLGVSGSVPGLTGSVNELEGTAVYPLTWENYQKLAEVMPLKPSGCSKPASFGTGDRLGMVTTAHLEADNVYPVFPIIAQQSPRELERTGRTFKGVMLDAVMGVLESGWTGEWGADADHIKDEIRFLEGLEAGYSMYTLDVSDDLQSADGCDSGSLTDLSKKIISDWAGRTISDYTFSESELTISALVYEKSMRMAERYHGVARSKAKSFDLEVSIDEGTRDTTPEDHLFVAEYLHRSGVDFTSLAPKFPGEFQKAVDYAGDFNALQESMRTHAEIARALGGYRLSLHSGSDKFSIYNLFADATQGHFHIKTSGTSWLQAIKLIAERAPALFRELYALCTATLLENKRAYHVYITPDHFPAEPPEDLLAFYAIPDVQQLFHISYGTLLEAKRKEIIDTLRAGEAQHYGFVIGHIDRHLKLLFGDK